MSERAFLADLLALIDQHGPFGDFTGSIEIVFATIRVQQSIRRGPVPRVSEDFLHALYDLVRQEGARAELEGACRFTSTTAPSGTSPRSVRRTCPSGLRARPGACGESGSARISLAIGHARPLGAQFLAGASFKGGGIDVPRATTPRDSAGT